MSASRLIKVYNSLPPEAQQRFVEKHLAGLLDAVPKDKSKKVMAAATRLQTKYKSAPKLDLRAKKRQIGEMLEELARDAKCSIVKERSNRDEILFEIFYGLVGWLNVIWSVVYEYNVQFATAHACLVFVADALSQLSETSALGGCKCSVMNLPVNFQLKDKNGKILKRFSIIGPQNIDRILLWIWRDLFVSLFVTGSEKDKARIPDFLKEIQEALGLRALERLVNGGQPSHYDDDWEDEDNDDLFHDEDLEDEDTEEDEDELDHDDDDDEGSHSRCRCKLHASYWSDRINQERTSLRDRVVDQLLATFKVTPSLRLYKALMNTANSPLSVGIELHVSRVLQEVAGDSPYNLVAAIEIAISTNGCSRVISLLDKYSYLLRPRDCHVLSAAVLFLSTHLEHRPRCLSILEAELEDSVQAICASVRSCFSYIEEEHNKAEMLEILKLKSSTQARKSRIGQWAEDVGSSNSSMGPMAFAAMMMGLPILPGVGDAEDLDMLNYFDIADNDPDMEELREEYRPNLKERFDNWIELGNKLPGGVVVLVKFYVKVIEKMPYVRGYDITNELINRLRDRPNKTHVADALSSVSTFAKIQRKKINLAHEKKQKNAAAGRAAANANNTTNQAKPNGKTNANATGSSGNTASSVASQPMATMPSLSSFKFNVPPPSPSAPADGMDQVD